MASARINSKNRGFPIAPTLSDSCGMTCQERMSDEAPEEMSQDALATRAASGVLCAQGWGIRNPSG